MLRNCHESAPPRLSIGHLSKRLLVIVEVFEDVEGPDDVEFAIVGQLANVDLHEPDLGELSSGEGQARQ